MIANIYSFTSGWNDWNVFVKLFDWLHYLLWEFVHLLGNIVDGLWTVLQYITSPEMLSSFLNNEVVARFFQASKYISITLLLLFFTWNLLLALFKPEQSPPLAKILKETFLCACISMLFLNIFTYGLDLATTLQLSVPKVYSNNTSDENLATKFSPYIISSFITIPESEKDFTIQDLQIALATPANTSCNKGSVSFWGCKYTDYNKGKFSMYFDKNSKYRVEISQNKIDEDNEEVAPMYNWRDTISNSLLRKADEDKNYVFGCGVGEFILLIIGLGAFALAFITIGFNCTSRCFELIILFILGPAIICTTICQENKRKTFWESLASLLLQTFGYLLVLFLAISFLSTISNISMPEAFNNNAFLLMLLKTILLVGLASYMLVGSKTIQSFISTASGGIGFKQALAVGASAFLLGKGSVSAIGATGGVALKGASGLASAKHAITTHSKAKNLTKANKDYQEKLNGQFTSAERSASRNNLMEAKNDYDKAVDKGNRYTENGKRKFTPANLASTAGDKLLGNKNHPKQEGIIGYRQRKNVKPTLEKANNISSSIDKRSQPSAFTDSPQFKMSSPHHQPAMTPNTNPEPPSGMPSRIVSSQKKDIKPEANTKGSVKK